MPTTPPVRTEGPPDADSLEWQAGIRALARLSRLAERACQSTGISLSQYRLLVSVGSVPRRANEVAATLGVSRPTLTSIVHGLEGRELVIRRVVASDRRGVDLELTEKGREAIERAESAMGRALAPLLDEETVRSALSVGLKVSRALDRLPEG
ncbi:MarR family transcriptional regulator [Myxococcota bacterium]|nr:MarR family transcriptional regulator [Myxococcota bacterium]